MLNHNLVQIAPFDQVTTSTRDAIDRSEDQQPPSLAEAQLK
jgi:hypothetical protein